LKKLIILVVSFYSAVALGNGMLRYQGGDYYNRTLINRSNITQQNANEQRTIYRMGKVIVGSSNLGTAFLIGERDGGFLFLTNNHVLKNQSECRRSTLTMMNERGRVVISKCHTVLRSGGPKQATDYTYFTVLKTRDNQYLSSLGDLEFANLLPRVGAALTVFGFGEGKFSKNTFDLKLSHDSDCILLSTNLKTLILEGDEVRNSLTTSCDTVNGDSGGIIIERHTGRAIGLLYGNAVQRRGKLRMSSRYIHSRLGTSPVDFFLKGSWAIFLNTIRL
jgi:hypothetical protein